MFYRIRFFVNRLPLTLPNVISQYLFFFFSFYIFLFVSLSTIYFYCRTTETPKGTNHRCSKMWDIPYIHSITITCIDHRIYCYSSSLLYSVVIEKNRLVCLITQITNIHTYSYTHFVLKVDYSHYFINFSSDSLYSISILLNKQHF